MQIHIKTKYGHSLTGTRKRHVYTVSLYDVARLQDGLFTCLPLILFPNNWRGIIIY